MKSSTKVTVQVEDYKGEYTTVTGFKFLKRNQAGNLKGFVGKEMVKSFGENNILAAMWFLDTDDSVKAQEFCEEHKIY